MSSYLKMVYNSTEIKGSINKYRFLEELKEKCKTEIDYFDSMGWSKSLLNLDSNNLEKWLLNEWNIKTDFKTDFEFDGLVYSSKFVDCFIKTIAQYLTDGLIIIVNIDYDYSDNYYINNGMITEIN